MVRRPYGAGTASWSTTARHRRPRWERRVSHGTLRVALHAAPPQHARRKPRRNIVAHYDLGNDFFSLFLDPSLMYSCAVFRSPDMTLAEASACKLDGVCRKLALTPGDRALEIGSGWGGFARTLRTIRMPRDHHDDLARQFEFTRAHSTAKASGIGYAARRDYRDLTGTYDKLVSIEMIEAVGHQYFDTFFHCSAPLEPGEMFLQAITIADHRTNLRAFGRFHPALHFPRQLHPVGGRLSASWRAPGPAHRALKTSERITPPPSGMAGQFARNSARVAMGLDEVPAHVGVLSGYCEGGFLEGSIGTAQVVLAKSGSRIVVR